MLFRSLIRYPTTRLLIVGDGSERDTLIRMVHAFGIKPHVVFKGWKDDLRDDYQFADCYLLTSNYEGYGRTVIEALASGLPVIMTDVGVAGETIQNEVNGLVVPVGDIEQLVSAMERILTDKALRSKFSQAGREFIRTLPSKAEYLYAYKNSWETCGKQM